MKSKITARSPFWALTGRIEPAAGRRPSEVVVLGGLFAFNVGVRRMIVNRFEVLCLDAIRKNAVVFVEKLCNVTH